jgi:hypothetical protein
MAEPPTLHHAAVAYARRGWPVFPLRPRDKAPATRHGCKDATADVDRVDRWWANHPDHNVGLAAGHAFDVLDLDGVDALDHIDQAAGDAPPLAGPMARTGKGLHVYVQPTGCGNRAGMLPGVDWRGTGGYVVAPPSIHPTGAIYEWTDLGPDTPLDPAPRWLFDLVAGTGRADTAGPVAQRWRLVDRGDGTAYGCAALERIYREMVTTPRGQGVRNQAANRCIWRIYRLVAAGEIDDRAADEFTRSALAQLYDDRPDSYREGIWRSARAAGLADPAPRQERVA